MARGNTAVIETVRLRFSGELRIGGQEHFYLETQCAIAGSTRPAASPAQSSTQHPSETQEMVARVLGVPATKSRSSACAWAALRRQGSAGERHGRPSPRWARGRRAGPCGCGCRAPRYGAHRQTPSVSEPLHAPVSATAASPRRAVSALLRRRLEPRPLRTRCSGARCFTATTPTSCPAAASPGMSAARTRRRRRLSAASADRKACW